MKTFYIGFCVLAILIAAALMTFFTEHSSALAFIGWAIFFAAIFGPALFFSRRSRFACRFLGN